MKRLSVYLSILCVAAFCLAQPVAAQAPVPAGEAFRQEGIASWYGSEFEGRPTASGEIFDSSLFTAAHPTLPYGTILLITNRHNNRQVTVKVNDRGPFVASRIIDVSRAAAMQLEMLNTGTAPVVIESIDRIMLQNIAPEYAPQQPVAVQPPAAAFAPQTPLTAPVAPLPVPVPQAAEASQAVQVAQVPQAASPFAPQFAPQPAPPVPVLASPPPALPPPPAAPEYAPPHSGAKLIPAIAPAPNKRYTLQVGSYKIARNAVDAFEKLKKAGLNPSYERNGEQFRVVLAGVRGNEVQSAADKLESAGFGEALIREEK